MHSFSIDYITREPANMIELEYKEYQNMSPPDPRLSTKDNIGNLRQTPSPTDSGMASDHSPSQQELAIAEALSSLEKRAAPPRGAPEVGGDDKPPHSYIALISMAILSSPDKKMLLCDIYQYIMDNFSYYNNDEKAWRNSIRHNLSLNECFVKNGRADNGKGNYWSIHPACEDDFSKGDFRRRQARRRARKSAKETGPTDGGMPYRYNLGYVPMTASHIGYHPYGTAASSLLYSQQTSPYPAMTSPQTTSPSNLTSLSAQRPFSFSQSDLSRSGYFSSPVTSPSQNYQFSNVAAAAAAHRLFSEQTTAALGAQSFPPNYLPSGLPCQNW